MKYLLLSVLLTLALNAAAQQQPKSATPPKQKMQGLQGNLTTDPAVKGPYPVRNDTAVVNDEIVTLRYSKIKKGTYPLWLKVSQEGVWPYFEKLGVRVVGAWQIVPVTEVNGYVEHADYDEIYLMTRYANLDHWKATRDAVTLGGNGPDYEKCRKALKTREDITIESTVLFLHGSMAANGPYFLPGLKENYIIK